MNDGDFVALLQAYKAGECDEGILADAMEERMDPRAEWMRPLKAADRRRAEWMLRPILGASKGNLLRASLAQIVYNTRPPVPVVAEIRARFGAMVDGEPSIDEYGHSVTIGELQRLCELDGKLYGDIYFFQSHTATRYSWVLSCHLTSQGAINEIRLLRTASTLAERDAR